MGFPPSVYNADAVLTNTYTQIRVLRTLENLENLEFSWNFGHALENLENLEFSWNFFTFPPKKILSVISELWISKIIKSVERYLVRK